jgi:hypothetical protein
MKVTELFNLIHSSPHRQDDLEVQVSPALLKSVCQLAMEWVLNLGEDEAPWDLSHAFTQVQRALRELSTVDQLLYRKWSLQLEQKRHTYEARRKEKEAKEAAQESDLTGDFCTR